MSSKDTPLKTIGVATALCVFFSVLVSTTAVKLKEKQEYNKKRDVQKNILASAGLLQDGKSIDELFKMITPVVVDLSTGEILNDVDPKSVSFEEDIAKESKTISIDAADDFAGIRKRLKRKKVYLVKNGDQIDKYILHIYGKGLWSTMYGFVVLKGDANTVEGFSFYQHGETPGLGGEVDNPKWKNSWQGKQIYDESKNVALDVIKGTVSSDTPNAQYKVDGLSGATITSNGVENTVKYWLGENGYKKFLSKVWSQNSSQGEL